MGNFYQNHNKFYEKLDTNNNQKANNKNYNEIIITEENEFKEILKKQKKNNTNIKENTFNKQATNNSIIFENSLVDNELFFDDNEQQKNKNESFIKKCYSEKISSKIPYWNETVTNLEEYLFDYSEKYSDMIFNLFNDIRNNPFNYIKDAENFGVDNIIEKNKLKISKPSLIIKNESLFFDLREILINNYNKKLNDNEIMNLILKCDKFNNFKYKKVFIIECNTEKDSIFILLKNNKKIAFYEIIRIKVDYCLICALPKKFSNIMKVYFLFLSH